MKCFIICKFIIQDNNTLPHTKDWPVIYQQHLHQGPTSESFHHVHTTRLTSCPTCTNVSTMCRCNSIIHIDQDIMVFTTNSISCNIFLFSKNSKIFCFFGCLHSSVIQCSTAFAVNYYCQSKFRFRSYNNYTHWPGSQLFPVSLVSYWLQYVPFLQRCQSFLVFHTFVIFMNLIFAKMRYEDGAGNIVEENSSVFSLIRMH